ncbi:Uu.00g078190.m01.CDS01 [Anthostomella pinea]|uniref:Uu.00g078190.m01.CDS01 n=1 Tax=Anthostomella pinea TaxID=933095 RepID=A0AAI8YJ84_9PEZI|nr:Uu.00g078190.m01.CDS01 [Anthostomella pinea]
MKACPAGLSLCEHHSGNRKTKKFTSEDFWRGSFEGSNASDNAPFGQRPVSSGTGIELSAPTVDPVSTTTHTRDEGIVNDAARTSALPDADPIPHGVHTPTHTGAPCGSHIDADTSNTAPHQPRVHIAVQERSEDHLNFDFDGALYGKSGEVYAFKLRGPECREKDPNHSHALFRGPLEQKGVDNLAKELKRALQSIRQMWRGKAYQPSKWTDAELLAAFAVRVDNDEALNCSPSESIVAVTIIYRLTIRHGKDTTPPNVPMAGKRGKKAAADHKFNANAGEFTPSGSLGVGSAAGSRASSASRGPSPNPNAREFVPSNSQSLGVGSAAGSRDSSRGPSPNPGLGNSRWAAAEPEAEKSTAEKTTAEKDTAEKDTAEKDTAEKDTAEKDTAEKEKAEKDKAEKDKAEKVAVKKAKKAAAKKADAAKKTEEATAAPKPSSKPQEQQVDETTEKPAVHDDQVPVGDEAEKPTSTKNLGAASRRASDQALEAYLESVIEEIPTVQKPPAPAPAPTPVSSPAPAPAPAPARAPARAPSSAPAPAPAPASSFTTPTFPESPFTSTAKEVTSEVLQHLVMGMLFASVLAAILALTSRLGSQQTPKDAALGCHPHLLLVPATVRSATSTYFEGLVGFATGRKDGEGCGAGCAHGNGTGIL